MEVLFYCSHCLFIKYAKPDYQVDPDWLFIPDADSINLHKIFSKQDKVICQAAPKAEIPTILAFPRKFLFYSRWRFLCKVVMLLRNTSLHVFNFLANVTVQLAL